MKGLLGTALALMLVLGATPSIARADDGEDADVTDVSHDDPGIASLHTALSAMREARTAMRAECPNMGDAKCRAAFKDVRSAFKEARKAAIEQHHAFRLEQKNARAAARDKAKAARPSQLPKAAKPAESPTPRASTRP